VSFLSVTDLTVVATKSAAAIDPATLCSGDGFVIAGTIHQVRNHTYQDVTTKRYHRFIAFVVDVDPNEVSSRVFVGGVEKERVAAYSHNVSRTGHLSTSYVKTNARHPNAVDIAELAAKISKGNSNGCLPLGLFDEGAAALHPAVTNRFEFWGAAADLKAADFPVGAKLHLKTKGNSHLIDMASNKDFTTTTGSGASFVDKCATANVVKKAPEQELEGVAEDEW
jgi:hypothetical protein